MNKINTNAVLIHTMGKVGSSSIKDSLKISFPNFSVYHTHFLEEERLKERINQSRTKSLVSHLKDSQEFISKQKNKEYDELNYKVITLVRDPIARNISAFFNNIDHYIPNFNNHYLAGEVEIEKAIKLFIERYPHHLPLSWFDLELNKVFNLNIYDQKFPQKKGYQIVSLPINLMVIRLEDLNKCFQPAFKEFLGVDDFELANSNNAESKKYQEAYKKFKQNIELPPDYIEKMYTSKYAKHFYSIKELGKLKSKWTQKRD